MTTNNARHAMSRGMAKGMYDPLTNLVREEEAAKRRAKIRETFRVLNQTQIQDNTRSDYEVATMPVQLSTAGEIPTMERTDDMFHCKSYHPDNSRHKEKYQQRSSLKTLFQQQAYDYWTKLSYD